MFMRLIILISLIFSFANAQQWQVRIYLENGSILDGFVKNEKFIEVFDGDSYKALPRKNEYIQRQIATQKEYIVREEQQIANTGLRLWYAGHSDGYVYLPYTQIHKIIFFAKKDILDKVHQQTQRLEKYYKKKKKRQRQQRRQRQRRKNVKYIEKRRKELHELREKLENTVLTQDQKDILKEFPPGPEWSHEERDKIHKQLNFARNNFTVRYIDGRKVIQKDRFGGVNKKEREFYDKYDRWSVAFEKKKKIQEMEKQLQRLEEIHGIDSDDEQEASDDEQQLNK